jgi:AcrR family transcriptional regulator
MPKKRLTREEKKAATRRALLDAAARVFARKGLQGATVEEISEDAGFSRGAFYSHFTTKEEILLEVIQERATQQMTAIAEAFQQDGALEERLLKIGQFVDTMAARDVEWCMLYMEFWSGAVRDRRLRARFIEQYGVWRGGIAALVESETRTMGVALGTPPEELASAIIALAEGYILQKLIDPPALPDDFFTRMLLQFVRGVMDPARLKAARAASR